MGQAGFNNEVAGRARPEKVAARIKFASFEMQNNKKKEVAIMPTVILEIAPAAGGREAEELASLLSSAYRKYADKHGLTVKKLSGTAREQSFELSGGNDDVELLRREAGVHRFQRQPKKYTTAENKMQTSTVCVSVLSPQKRQTAELDERDLEISIARGSGKGGQKRNKTETAVQIKHVPSGIIVYCDDERSQKQNKEKALEDLRTRLQQITDNQSHDSRRRDKQGQISRGERANARRTYNFPRSVAIDHLSGKRCSLKQILDKADFG
jgi:peptide chain release factor 1